MTFYTRLNGDQFAMPDTRLTQREKVEAKAQAPLASTSEQKPMDVGLWDEDRRNQQDLLDRLTVENGK